MLAALLALGLAACATSGGGDPDAGGIGGSAGGTGGAGNLGGNGGGAVGGAGGGACNALTPSGSFVAPTAGVGTAPRPAGGTIGDGTYLLTRYDIYPPSSVGGSFSSKETLRVAGNRLEDARIDQDAPTTATNINLSFSTSGTALAMTRTCGATGSFSQDFTATATTLSFIDGNQVLTYTKQ